MLPSLRGNPTLNVQCRLESIRKILSRAFAPEVSEKEGRFLADHVVVKGDDVNAGFAKGAQYRLDFLGGHNEVAVHRRQLVAARKGSPCLQAHQAPDLDALHRPLSSDGPLHTPSLAP